MDASKQVEDLRQCKRQLEHDIDRLKGRLASVARAWELAKEDWRKLQAFAVFQGFEIKARFPSAPDPFLYVESSEDSFFDPADDNEKEEEEFL